MKNKAFFNVRGNNFLHKIAYLTPLVFILFYFIQVFCFTYNFPFYDDYDTIISFLNRFSKEKGILNKTSLIFEQHNEHRIAVNRLIVLAQKSILGEINFTGLVYIGNFFLLGSFIIVISNLSNSNKLILLITPVFFSFLNWANSLWAMAALQNFGLPFFSIAFIHFFIRGKLGLSVLFAAFALFSSGGGVVILPLLIVLQFFLEPYSKKNFTFLLTAILALVLFYFWGFENSDSVGSFILLPWDITLFLKYVLYVLTFLGTILTLESTPYLSAFLGFFILTSYLLLFFNHRQKKQPFLFGLMTFILLISILVSIGRFSYGMESANISRYRIYSTLATIAMISIFFTQFKFSRKTVFYYPLLIGSISFFFLSFVSLRYRLDQSKELRQADEFLFQFGELVKGHPKPIASIDVLKHAENLGYFTSKYKGLDQIESKLPTNYLQGPIVVSTDFIKKRGSKVSIAGFAYPENTISNNMTIFFANDSLLYKTYFTRRYDLVKEKGLTYQNSGFVLSIDKKKFNELKYIYVKIGNTFYRDKISFEIDEKNP